MQTEEVQALSPTEFYHRRGDRARRLVSSLRYQQVPVSITAGDGVGESPVGQAMILTASNLCARWARKIDVRVPDRKLRSPIAVEQDTDRFLLEEIHAEVREADPFCDLQFQEPREEALILQIGPDTSSAAVPNYAIAADGWDAVGWRPNKSTIPRPKTDSQFIPAGQLAACIGVGQIFKEALGFSGEKLPGSVRWRLWNHETLSLGSADQKHLPSPPSGTFQAGRLLQVGIGAVGSNVLYLLGQTGVEAILTLVDFDEVEVENLDRTLLFGVNHIRPGHISSSGSRIKKVHAAQEALSGVDHLAIDPFDGSWNEFVEKRLGEEHYDLWFALANEMNAWCSMAENYPPLVLHGTTSTDWRVTLGRHIPLSEYCLRCRFEPSGSFQSICGEGTVEVESGETGETDEVHASLPFLSAAAAALVVGELLKTRTPGYRSQPNYVEADFRGGLNSVLALQKQGKSTCSVCSDPPPGVWQSRIEESRYGFLSNGDEE